MFRLSGNMKRSVKFQGVCLSVAEVYTVSASELTPQFRQLDSSENSTRLLFVLLILKL
jgi:hypothetical protein